MEVVGPERPFVLEVPVHVGREGDLAVAQAEAARAVGPGVGGRGQEGRGHAPERQLGHGAAGRPGIPGPAQTQPNLTRQLLRPQMADGAQPAAEGARCHAPPRARRARL